MNTHKNENDGTLVLFVSGLVFVVLGGLIGMPLSKYLMEARWVTTWRAVKLIMLAWEGFSVFVAYRVARKLSK